MQGPSTLGGGGAPDPTGSVPRRGPSASIREEARRRRTEAPGIWAAAAPARVWAGDGRGAGGGEEDAKLLLLGFEKEARGGFIGCGFFLIRA
jgi:hypothetical protein